MQQEGISYEEAEYAETFAFSMMRWSGAASRHDIGTSAYDAWTRVTETEAYRRRQSGENQGGIHGNPYSLAGFKRMGADFFVGAKDVNNKSILELIQGGQGDNVNLRSNLGDITFESLAMEKFGTDHISRVFKIYHDIIESHEFNFDKIVSIDPWGRVIFDPKAATEFIDGPLKAFRYGYRTWGGLDYSKDVRVAVRDNKGDIVRNEDGTIKYEVVSVGEALWGKQVYMDFVNGKNRNGDKRAQDTDLTPGDVMERRSNPNNREEYWKRPLMYMIAAEIRAHTTFESGYVKYNFGQIQKIYDWLEHMSGALEYDENDMSKTRRDPKRMFFSKEDIKWIRRVSGTSKFGLYMTEILNYGLTGGMEGFWAGAKTFFSAIFKD
jgi:hypothetical protein